MGKRGGSGLDVAHTGTQNNICCVFPHSGRFIAAVSTEKCIGEVEGDLTLVYDVGACSFCGYFCVAQLVVLTCLAAPTPPSSSLSTRSFASQGKARVLVRGGGVHASL